MSFALGRARGVRFGSASGAAPVTSTVVALGHPRVWPNPGATQFLAFADASWMLPGQALDIDDGVHRGVLTIVAIYSTEDGTIVECAWTADGPAFAPVMLDGAAVNLVP